MLWYGNNKVSNIKKYYKNRNYNCNAAIKTLALPILRHGSQSATSVYIYIPSNWDLVILNIKSKIYSSYLSGLNPDTKLLYIYSSIYYFKIPVLQTYLKWYFDPSSRTIRLLNRYIPSFYKFYFKQITTIFYSFSRVFFTKLKFKGKGYYIYKNYRSTITHQFGHSHRWYIYSYFVSVRFLTKTTVFIFGSSKHDIFSVGNNIQASKYINIFTGRGVRFARQVIYKKTGKVSSYR